MAKQPLKTFEVIRTPKLRDSEGNYVKRGDKCRLTQELAEHYHALGYIRVTMDDLFSHADSTNKRPEPGAASETGIRQSIDPEPTSGAGSDDDEEADDDVEDDAGTSASEESPRSLINRRRKRASS